MSEWSDTKRRLSPEASAEPGRWTTSRAEFQRGIMDAISAYEEVIVISSSQVGKTEIVNNVAGYFIDQDPSPILVLQPTLAMASDWSKNRLAPMLRDTPVLKGRVRNARTRDSGNTILEKVFHGGSIAIAGANSAASLAARPRRILICDEVDRYPPSAGKEGDPVTLAEQRTSNFWNRKIVKTSTPTVKGVSRIEAEWEVSDQRRFFVPCPHCGEFDHLQWKNVKWPQGRPDEAAYVCGLCGVVWTEGDRLTAIRKGHWRITRPEGKKVGFHLNAIYSPWITPAKLARQFHGAGKDPERLKAFVNTKLGEVWEEDLERTDASSLTSRLEEWPRDGSDAKGYRMAAPAQVTRITCGVDVQDDRLEIERVGWSKDEESWSLDYHVIYGDPSTPALWADLDAYLALPSPRVGAEPMLVSATAIDSGGHYTQMVYKFCAPRLRRRIFAIKGSSVPGRPVWPKRAKKGRHGKDKSLVFIVGTDSAKDVVLARLKMTEAGPGYAHFPVGRDRVYFDQLTSNVVRIRRAKGFPMRVYELPSGARDEALDCRVYAYAALQSFHLKMRTHIPERVPTSSEQKPVEPRPVSLPVPSQQRPARARPATTRRGSWLRR